MPANIRSIALPTAQAVDLCRHEMRARGALDGIATRVVTLDSSLAGGGPCGVAAAPRLPLGSGYRVYAEPAE